MSIWFIEKVRPPRKPRFDGSLAFPVQYPLQSTRNITPVVPTSFLSKRNSTSTHMPPIYIYNMISTPQVGIYHVYTMYLYLFSNGDNIFLCLLYTDTSTNVAFVVSDGESEGSSTKTGL